MFSHIKELFTRPSGYSIAKSVRLRNSASAYFNRTPASAGNNQKFTWSGWVKRGTLSVLGDLFSAGTGDNNRTLAFFQSDNTLIFGSNNSGTYYGTVTTAVFRDPSAWYHIVFAVDTTQATTANRVRIYINGIEQTSTSAWNSGYIPQNTTTYINTTNPQVIGANPTYGLRDYYDGYLTEVNFVDGQQLTPSSFGSTNALTGVWQPAKYSGTYGTNGFYLNFSDNSNNTAATIGKDYSGNGNNWTPNNISVTSGVTYDSMVDSPTVSAVSSNYAVWNQLQKTSTLSQANLLSAGGGSAIFYSVASTISIPSGKWYWEITCVSNTDGLTGIVETNQMIDVIRNGNYVGQTSLGYGYHANGKKYNNATSVAYGATYTTNDIIGVAFNADTGDLTFYKNGTSQGTAYTVSTAYTWLPADSVYASDSKAVNFGQRPFAYTPPTGFVALNTWNLPDSTIKNGGKYMNILTWSGTGGSAGATRSLTGLGFQPDFVWEKDRASAQSHHLFDSVRGAGTSKTLASDSTGAEGGFNDTLYGYLSSFDADGFTTTNGSSTWDNWNKSGDTYVGWSWKAGTTSASNTNGSITSTVSVGATQGFSVVTFSGASAGTVGHGLGVAPKMIFIKTRTTVLGWYVYTETIGANGWLQLNTSAAAVTGNPAAFGGTAPTSTVFSYGSGLAGTGNYVAYCFSAVAGYSAFGSYTGNGSADGVFVYLGFRPKWILLKRTDSAADWFIGDTSRNTANSVNNLLQPSSANAESTYGAGAGEWYDLLSNGFKIRSTITSFNASGGTYIYACFAENPFKYSLAR